MFFFFFGSKDAVAVRKKDEEEEKETEEKLFSLSVCTSHQFPYFSFPFRLSLSPDPFMEKATLFCAKPSDQKARKTNITIGGNRTAKKRKILSYSILPRVFHF